MSNRTAVGELNLTVNATIRNVLTDGTAATSSVGGAVLALQLTNGVAANQISRAWFRSGTNKLSVLSGNFKDLDLATLGGQNIGAGNGKDALGQLMDNEELVALIIHNDISSTGSLEIMKTVPGAAPIAWIPASAASVSLGGGIKPGGVRLWAEPSKFGLPVTVAVSNVLRLTANGGDCNVSIYLLGRHDIDESSSNTTSSSISSSVSSSSVSSSS